MHESKNVTFRPSIEENLNVLKGVHPQFVCIHGFLNSEHHATTPTSRKAIEKQHRNKDEEDIIPRIQEYFRENKTSINDLFPGSFQVIILSCYF